MTTHNHTDTHDKAFVATRRIRVQAFVGEDAIRSQLEAVPGVVAAHVDRRGRGLRVRYDMREVAFGQIEAALTHAGSPPANAWFDRLKAWWFRYLDRNAQANARSRGACCSSPGDIYAGRHKR